METDMGESHSRSHGYAFGPPWLFRGRALYQLHLVKSEIARAFIPKELKLVEAFGYTLGGFFLAHYDDSPAGVFDELVIISGIVWNPPTSCAWAARVLVNSEEACSHGRKEIGLPSQVANFSKKMNSDVGKLVNKSRGYFGLPGITDIFHHPKENRALQISEIGGSATALLCTLAFPLSTPATDKAWPGPKIKMSLPSFSGKTKYNPNLLKYSCQIECRMQTVYPAKISALTTNDAGYILDCQNTEGSGETDQDAWNRCISIMMSKPILALRFNSLKMSVQAPSLLSHPDGEGNMPS